MRDDAEAEIDRLRRDRLKSTGADPGTVSPSPEPDRDTQDAVLCCSGSDAEKTLDDLFVCVEDPAAPDGGGANASQSDTEQSPPGRTEPGDAEPVTAAGAPESAPGTAATATAEPSADTTSGLAECDAGPAHHSIPASDAPGVTTSRSATMEIRTSAALDPTLVPTASHRATAGPPSLPSAKPPNDQRPPDNADSADNVSGDPELPFDSITDLIPPRSGAEYEEHKEDIRAHPLDVIIWRYKGRIIHDHDSDRACRELGITPKYQEWHGQGSLVAFVLTLNVGDRHLSESQRAMVAARSIPMFKDEAKQRKQAGKAADHPLHAEEGRKGEAAEFAARMVGVGAASVYKAQNVLKKGIQELQQAVDADQVKVAGAELLACLDEGVQREAVAGGSAAMEKKIRELRAGIKGSKAKSDEAPGPAAEPERPAPSGDTRVETEAEGRPAEAGSREGTDPKGTDVPALHPPEPQRPGTRLGDGSGSQAAGAAPGVGSTKVADPSPADTGASPEAPERKAKDQDAEFTDFHATLVKLKEVLERDQGGFAVQMRKLKPEERDRLQEQMDSVTDRLQKLRKEIAANLIRI
jgi:hypothetical protein